MFRNVPRVDCRPAIHQHPRMSNSMFKLETKIFLAVFLIGFLYAGYTQHAWEDFFIAFRGAENLANGHGLVYTQGERLQSFSSPIGVLIPALIIFLTGHGSVDLVLWIYRLFSLAAFSAGVVLLFQIIRRFQHHIFATVFTIALVALDAKSVDFATNGMETGLLLFFLALTLHGLFISGQRQVLRIGLGWAGLMWSRPDSCVYIAALGLGALMFLPSGASGMSRKEWWKLLLKAGVLCTILYLPWFLWAWWYYGSPVPHTIAAKGTNAPPLDALGIVSDLFLFPLSKLTSHSAVWETYMPAYGGGDWPRLLQAVCLLLAWAAALAWIFPLLRPQTRVLSFGCYIGQVYLTDVIRNIFPWYLPTVAVMGYLVLGLILDQVLCFAERLPKLNWDRGWFGKLSFAAKACAVGLLVGQGFVFVNVARQMWVEQVYIEDGVRREIGLWLREHAKSPNDTVMVEPLGYIGFYSKLKMLDFPGLVSKEMVETRRKLGPEQEGDAYLELKPDWIVLRPSELQGGGILKLNPKRINEFYETATVFDASEKIRSIGWLPGRGMPTFDQTFIILHRKATPEPATQN